MTHLIFLTLLTKQDWVDFNINQFCLQNKMRANKPHAGGRPKQGFYWGCLNSTVLRLQTGIWCCKLALIEVVVGPPLMRRR